jgi:hypothetical protein
VQLEGFQAEMVMTGTWIICYKWRGRERKIGVVVADSLGAGELRQLSLRP